MGTYSGGMRRRIDIACGLVVRPEVVFLDEPTTGLDPRSRQVIWDLVASFKNLGISTLLTTQYLEEADALSDRIIVIDHGEIVAEGTADELKERTGGSYCEIVPRDLNDLPAVVAALGPLLPEKNRAAALASESDRIAMPAPRGPNTLVEALALLNAANIELRDIALRRPSLDDVFLALTSDNTGTARVQRICAQGSVSTSPPSRARRSGRRSTAGHPGRRRRRRRSATQLAARPVVGGGPRQDTGAWWRSVAIAVTAVSLFVLKKDSAPARGSSRVPPSFRLQRPHRRLRRIPPRRRLGGPAARCAGSDAGPGRRTPNGARPEPSAAVRSRVRFPRTGAGRVDCGGGSGAGGRWSPRLRWRYHRPRHRPPRRLESSSGTAATREFATCRPMCHQRRYHRQRCHHHRRRIRSKRRSSPLLAACHEHGCPDS